VRQNSWRYVCSLPPSEIGGVGRLSVGLAARKIHPDNLFFEFDSQPAVLAPLRPGALTLLGKPRTPPFKRT
jgi:hypothetical protein